MLRSRRRVIDQQANALHPLVRKTLLQTYTSYVDVLASSSCGNNLGLSSVLDCSRLTEAVGDEGLDRRYVLIITLTCMEGSLLMFFRWLALSTQDLVQTTALQPWL